VDGFSYLVSDGTAESSVATVTLNVNPTNDAPVAANDEYTLEEDSTLTVEADGVLANDTDPDGDPLTASLISEPQHGTLVFNSDGSFTYTPEPDFTRLDGFSYLVTDGTSESSVATVSLNVTSVNDAPVAADDSYSVEEDGVFTVEAGGILDNDTDADGDSLTPTLVTGPEHGTLVLNDDGSFTYTPDPDFNGTDSFTYTVNDGTTDSAPATVTIDVTA